MKHIDAVEVVAIIAYCGGFYGFGHEGDVVLDGQRPAQHGLAHVAEVEAGIDAQDLW